MHRTSGNIGGGSFGSNLADKPRVAEARHDATARWLPGGEVDDALRVATQAKRKAYAPMRIGTYLPTG